MGQNIVIMGATWLGALLDTNMLLLFTVPGIIGFVFLVAYALTIPDPVLRENRYPFNLLERQRHAPPTFTTARLPCHVSSHQRLPPRSVARIVA